MAAGEIQDDGEYLPGSAKERVALQQLEAELAGIEPEQQPPPSAPPEFDGLPVLDDWWPEPDWQGWVKSGLPAQLAADLFTLRNNLPNRPPSGCFSVDNKDWATIYLRAIEAMKAVLASLRMDDTADTLCKRYEAALGTQRGDSRRRDLPPERRFAPYGLGRFGGRTLQHPFTFTPLSSARRRAIANLGWPLDEDIPHDPRWLPLEVIDRATGEIQWRVYRVNSTGYIPSGEPHDDEEMAIIEAILKIKGEVKAAREAGGRNPYERPGVLDSVERIGPDLRQGRDVSTDELMSLFGFRGIQFGNWVPQQERQALLNFAWEALHDLMAICGLPPAAASLGGTLALAFGARGKPGVAAHFEPTRRILHFSRKNGAGALAHEWGHAADNYLGILEHRERIRAHRRQFPGVLGNENDAIADSHLFNLSTSAHRDDSDGVLTKPMQEAMTAIRRAPAGADGQRPRSRFFKDAVEIGGPGGTYWQCNEELWARAFEAWVYDALTARSLRSDYLVYGVDEARWAKPGQPSPYPAGEERRRIGQHIEAAFDAWRPMLSRRPA